MDTSPPVDLFYELSLPPFLNRDEQTLFQETLEELTLADELGFHGAWLVEHHFMPAYAHSSAPAVFLAAAASRTRHLRLGHAIVPLPYHHPIQVAEALATLDLVSGGRVDFGFGRGFSPLEYETFGVPMGESRSRTEEALAVLRAFFAGGPLSFHGRHFQFHDLNVVPRPVQRPHPPLWMAAVSPESFDIAARLGVGALVGPFKPWFMIREDIARYRRAWREHQADPAPGANGALAMTVGIYCHEDRRQARREAKRAMEWFYGNLLDQTAPILQRLYDGYEYYRRMAPAHRIFRHAVHLRALEAMGMVVVGDPAHCRARLQALIDDGVDRLLLAVGAGAMPSERVRASLRLLAAEVLPHLRPRER